MRGAIGLLALALMALGCTAPNPGYCSDAGKTHRCSDAGTSKDAAPETNTGDGRDAKDGPADGAVDRPMEPTPICTTDDQCPADGGRLACLTGDAGAPMCVECTDSMKHCKDAKKPACDTKAHVCVECVDNTTCVTDKVKPICDATNLCRACRSDGECKDIGPGICVDWDGHCATAAEVVLLERNAVDCDPASSKFCTSASLAVAALTTQKPILLISGTTPVSTLEISAGVPAQILIVGRGGASIGAGPGDTAGVHVSGVRKAYVRDIKISGGTVGVLAEQGADLRLTRCTIVQNMAGGIQTRGASYDITNTIIASNDQGDATGGLVWAGARLGTVPAGGMTRFENNTVAANKATGVVCEATQQVKGTIVYGNAGVAQTAGCAPDDLCCGGANTDPKLDAAYHLMMGSPCIDKITATAMSVTVDIQGQPRPPPSMGRLDCGADEYLP
jgi:hypothetical protein